MIKEKEDDSGIRQSMPLKSELLTSAQAAEYLDLSMAKLYGLTSTRAIPFYKPTGGKLYFRRTELENWVWSHKVATIIDISMEANNYLLNQKLTA